MQKVTRAAALLLVALAVVLAIVAFNLSRRAVQSASGPTATNPVTTDSQAAPNALQPAVVASSALPAGQAITRSALRVAKVAHPVAGGYSAIDAVLGDTPLVDIPAGVPITSRLLAHGLAMQLKPGERALAVPVDELAGAGNRIVPGDYVDVFLNLKAPPTYTNGKPEPSQTRLLLSRLRVLAYGSEDLPVVPPPVDAAAPSAAASSKRVAQAATAKAQDKPPARTAVLAVPLGQVDRLLLGAQDGKLALALRHPADEGKPDPQLFPQFRSALAPLAQLTPAQRQQLGTPEERAFAGIDGRALAARPDALAKPATAQSAQHTRTTHRVEIIRGTKVDSP